MRIRSGFRDYTDSVGSIKTRDRATHCSLSHTFQDVQIGQKWGFSWVDEQEDVTEELVTDGSFTVITERFQN